MRRLLAVCIAVPLALPLPAGAQTKPLRTLVYDVTYSAHAVHSKRTSGFNGAYGEPGMGAAGVGSGNGTASVALDGDDRGELTVDVIAATPDGGLVVDVAYSGRSSSQPKTRVALLPDGRMSSDPAQPLSTQAVHLLPLLARTFIANRDVSPGSSWDVAQPPPVKGKTTYKVSSLQGNRALIALQGSMSVPGVSGFEETEEGTTTYATDLINPVTYDVSFKVSRATGMDETITTTAHLMATLRHDTFAKT